PAAVTGAARYVGLGQWLFRVAMHGRFLARRRKPPPATALPSSHSREAHTVVPVLHTNGADPPRRRDTVKGPSQVFVPAFHRPGGSGRHSTRQRFALFRHPVRPASAVGVRCHFSFAHVEAGTISSSSL